MMLEGTAREFYDGTNINIARCISEGSTCSSTSQCCSGLIWKIFHPLPVSRCVWCPGPGDTCGFLDPCCPGYTCLAFFSGTCSYDL